MRKTDRLKGQIYKLLDRGNHLAYKASFDITAHSCLIDGKTIHIAFAEDIAGTIVVTFCQVNPAMIVYNHTRTLAEILTEKSQNPYGHDVFPAYFICVLARFGISKEEYQEIVGTAYDDLDYL